GGAVGRGVVRNDQLKVFVCLAEQGVERLGKVVFAVVDREPDAEPGSCVHLPPLSISPLIRAGAVRSNSMRQSALRRHVRGSPPAAPPPGYGALSRGSLRLEPSSAEAVEGRDDQRGVEGDEVGRQEAGLTEHPPETAYSKRGNAGDAR